VTIEAMASGLPVVGARAGGSATLIQNEVTGLHANPKDAHDFAEQVTRLLDDESLRLRLRENGIRFAHEHTWDKVFERFVEIYEGLVKKS
jgi:glycosyltransferase involved in cell wall biosynthesis